MYCDVKKSRLGIMGCAESSQILVDTVNRKPVRVTFLGLSKSGKTSIIEVLKNEYVCFIC